MAPEDYRSRVTPMDEEKLELERVETNKTIAETFSLPHEILFVAVICLAQLFTRMSPRCHGPVNGLLFKG